MTSRHSAVNRARAGETKIRQTMDERDVLDLWIFNQNRNYFSTRVEKSQENVPACVRSTTRSTYLSNYLYLFYRVPSSIESARERSLGDKSRNQRSSNKEKPGRHSGRSGSEVTQLKRNPTMTNHSVNKFPISNRCLEIMSQRPLMAEDPYFRYDIEYY